MSSDAIEVNSLLMKFARKTGLRVDGKSDQDCMKRKLKLSLFIVFH